MASITRDGERWRARYRDPSGRQVSQRFGRKVDAQRWLDEAAAGMVTGAYVDPRGGRVTVAEHAAIWEAGLIHSDGSARNVDNALRLHLLPVLGTLPLASVRRNHVQAVIKAMTKTHAPGTVGNVADVAGRLFAAAVEDRLIAVSPAARLSRPRNDRKAMVIPTVAQVGGLRDAMLVDDHQVAVVVLAGTGLRIGELLGLQVGDVDFLRRTIQVDRQRLQNGEIAATKTPSSVRTVPVGQVVLDALAGLLARRPGRAQSDASLFWGQKGQPLRYNAWKTPWKRANAALGLDLDTHDLRHFYASALIAGGASVKQVQTILGHASPEITLRIYIHLWPGDDDRARGISDAVLEPLASILRPTAVSS